MLTTFRQGWRNKFEEIVNRLVLLYPDAILVSEKRFSGMLKIKFKGLDNHSQYVLDSVSFKIERDSATTCEQCGDRGTRRKNLELLPEVMCLCWTCYALEVDSVELHNKSKPSSDDTK
jgi:hypothetical protein